MVALLAAAIVILVLVGQYRYSKLEQNRLLVLYDRIAVERDALLARLSEDEGRFSGRSPCCRAGENWTS